MVYTEHAEMAAISHGTSHIMTKKRCRYITSADIQNATVNHSESHVTKSAVSLLRMENSTVLYKRNQLINDTGSSLPHQTFLCASSTTSTQREPHKLKTQRTGLDCSEAACCSIAQTRHSEFSKSDLVLKHLKHTQKQQWVRL